jgi:type II secretion system protein G
MKKKGFTLIELMIVVAIIGLLAAVAMPKFTNVSESAKAANVQGNLASMRTAIAMFHAKSDEYPDLVDNEDALGDVTATDTTIEFTDFYSKSKAPQTPGEGSSLSANNDIETGTTSGNAITAETVDGGWAYAIADGGIRANLADNAYGQGIEWDEE